MTRINTNEENNQTDRIVYSTFCPCGGFGERFLPSCFFVCFVFFVVKKLTGRCLCSFSPFCALLWLKKSVEIGVHLRILPFRVVVPSFPKPKKKLFYPQIYKIVTDEEKIDNQQAGCLLYHSPLNGER